jgi:hypothetical protein
VTATLPEAPPVVDWRQRALDAERLASRLQRQLKAVDDECWAMEGRTPQVPTLGIAARRVRAAIAEAEQEPDETNEGPK